MGRIFYRNQSGFARYIPGDRGMASLWDRRVHSRVSFPLARANGTSKAGGYPLVRPARVHRNHIPSMATINRTTHSPGIHDCLDRSYHAHFHGYIRMGRFKRKIDEVPNFGGLLRDHRCAIGGL